MNKIYKVIWSKAKHTYVVASEIAKGHTKGETTGRGLKKLAAAMLVAAALLSPNFVWAADMVKVDESASDTAVEVYTKKGTDTQVNAAKTYTYRKVAAEEKVREAADTELNERITNEANEIHKTTNQLQSDLATETADRKAADEALDSRAKALEDKTEAITYDKDSKTVMVEGKLTATEGITDGTTKDGQYVKADHYVGQNLNALDQGLQAETAARQAADTTLQTNIDNEAAERKAADTVLDDKITAETSARVAADTKLVEAVNSGLSLSNDNVLQKNTTTIDAQGNVTTSKTDANEMILNKGKDNQITLNENGIKVGTNSTVVDKDGVYTGGDTYAAAKAAMSADGKIKGANGAFTVDENGNVASKATITGETVTDGKGASMSNGTVTGKTLTDGIATITNGNINTRGSVTGGTVTSTGNISAVGDIHAGGAITGASASIQGALTAGSATITGDLTAGGAIQGKSISDGTATMQNGNITGVKNLSAETITTSGDATIGGDLTVNGQLNVDEIDLTKSGIVGDNNVTASTKVAAGKITSYKKATSTKDGSEKESAIDYDKNSTSTWAKATDADGNWNKSTLTVEGSDVTSKVVDSEKNSNLFTQTSTQSQSTLTDKDNNTNVSTQTASESSSVVSGKDGEKTYKSYITQNLKEILQKIEDGDGHVLTSTEQTETDITNTAKNGTIANEAKDITNHATENMTNTVGGKLLNDVTGDMENKVGGNLITTVSGTSTETVTGKKTETYNDGLETTVTGEEKHTVNGSQTNSITGDQVNTIGGKQTTTVTGDVTEDYKANLSTTVGGSQTTTVIGDSSLTAENINNTAKNKITNKALDVETDAASSIVSKVSNDAGSNTSTQLSYQTKEEMSQADGKTASYLRGAAEEKSQLTDGAKKTTIDTVAGQTNTNITDGTNISNSLQKADQAASSVTDGTNTTVVNQDAKSLASSITDGAKANNTSSTVDASVQRIQTDDTHYSVSSKSASKMEDALFNGSTVIDSLKDAEKGLVSTAVTDGTNLTGSSMTAKGITSSAAESIVNEIGDGSAVKSEMTANGITNTAKDGTITNDAKDLVNTASNSITDKVGENVERTMTTEKIQDKVGKTTVTTTDGLTKLTNEGGTHKTEMDFADVLKDLGVRGNATVDKKLTVKGDSDLQGNATVGKDLEVKGSTKLDGTLEVVGKSTFKDDVTMEKNLDVKGITTTDKLVVNNGATVAGGTTTDTLHVTSTATFDDIVTMKKDLSVGGNVDAASYTVKDTGIKIDKNGINAGGTKVTGLAPADISHAGSTDAVSGGQLYETNTRVSGLETRMGTVETRVDKLDNKIDKVGANAAAMANLHPLEFDEDSKWNVAAAVGSSGSETASAVGVFYRPNENVMVNASAAMGTGENMFGGGVSLRLGHGGNKAKEAQMKAAAAENKELRAKVDDLTARMDALLSVLNPNMSKDFPDVPENHWAYEAVSRLAGNGIVEGYEDGKYHGERQMTRYEMAEIIYNALSKGAKAEKKLVEEFRPELQAMAVQKKA
uniref:ESPR-type extended signal peptide-containing protein n=1 Tax=Dialister succinatiphilus TaxID=487173 RepID=UPI0040389623